MRASLVLLTLVSVLCVSLSWAQVVQTSQSTDDDGNLVFSVQMTSSSDDDTPSVSASPFRMFNNLRPFHLFSRPSFPRFLQFSEPPEEKEPFPMFENLFSHELADSPSVSIEVRHLGDEDDEETDDSNEDNDVAEELHNRLSTFFSRISSIFNTVREQSVNGGFQSQQSSDSTSRRKGARRLGGCTLLQACGKDIDAICGYAKRINIAQAIPRCLSSHRPQLSSSCGQYIDRFYSTAAQTADEAVTAETASETTAESSDAPAAEPVKKTVEPTAPTTPQAVCHAAAQTMCPDLPAHNMVAVMACLYRRRESVPELCLNHIKDTAAFNCALDAERFCPGVIHRRGVGHCLKAHKKELSEACTNAAHKLASKTSAATPAVSTPTADLPMKISSMSTKVAAAADASPAETNSSSFLEQHSVALGVGLGAFVVVAVVAAIVVVRRRRARRVRLPVVSTVQLVNPSN